MKKKILGFIAAGVVLCSTAPSDLILWRAAAQETGKPSLVDLSRQDIEGFRASLQRLEHADLVVFPSDKIRQEGEKRSSVDAALQEAFAAQGLELPEDKVEEYADTLDSNYAGMVEFFGSEELRVEPKPTDSEKVAVFFTSNALEYNTLGVFIDQDNQKAFLKKNPGFDLKKINIDFSLFTKDLVDAHGNWHEQAHLIQDRFFQPAPNDAAEGESETRSTFEEANVQAQELQKANARDCSGDSFATMKLALAGQLAFAKEMAKLRQIDSVFFAPAYAAEQRKAEPFDGDLFFYQTGSQYHVAPVLDPTLVLMETVTNKDWEKAQEAIEQAYARADHPKDEALSSARAFVDLFQQGTIDDAQLVKLSVVLTGAYGMRLPETKAMMAYQGAGEIGKTSSLYQETFGEPLSPQQKKFLSVAIETAAPIMALDTAPLQPRRSPQLARS